MRDLIRAKIAIVAILILGLSTPGWSQAPSKFDSGNQGTSALGQLEDLAGQKVDKSPGVNTIDAYKKKITLPQKTAPKIKVNPSASMQAMVTGMVVGSLIQAIFSDDSEQRANAAAARALAEAEQKRLLEEQRQQRIQSAGRLRNFWDQRDREISESLEDVFSLPGQGQGTRFFNASTAGGTLPADGAPAPPGDSFGTPGLIGSGAPAISMVSAPALPEPAKNEFQERLVKEGVAFAQDVAVQAAKSTATELAMKLLPEHTAANLGMMLDYKERFTEWSANLFKAIEPDRLTRAIAGESTAYAAVMQDLDKVQRQAITLALPNNPLSNDEMEIAYKLLNKQTVTFDEVTPAAIGRVKGFFSDKLKDRLLRGLS
jgi:hypothetical protein